MLGIAILGLSYVELLIVKMKQTVRVLGTIFIGCFVVLYVGYFTAVAANHNTVNERRRLNKVEASRGAMTKAVDCFKV